MPNSLPKLAIVGRPNVGKSALFNRLCKKRISIVDEAEGVTRDRLYAKADFFGVPFEVIDTGGIDRGAPPLYNGAILRQAEIAIEEADYLVQVVDGQVGPTHLDLEVSRILHTTGKSVTIAVNKLDTHEQMDWIHRFHGLGFSDIVGISAVHGLHIAELLEVALKGADWERKEIEEDGAVQVAVVGRPNVGKSTFVNSIADQERCLVGPNAGTTRDSVDLDLEVEGKIYRLIDTAGIGRKKSEKEVVEKFAMMRTQKAIERSHVCLLMLDASEGLTAQEKKIINQIEAAGKGCILLFNKWDKVKGFRMEHCLQAVHQEAPFTNHCPALFISAKTGRNLDKIYEKIDQVDSQLKTRISTGELNRFLEKAVEKCHPPMLMGKRLRIYYTSQIGICPPRFIFFVNKPKLMVDSYKKYLINAFRKAFSFAGAPLEFSLKGKTAARGEKETRSSSEGKRKDHKEEESKMSGPG